MTSFRTLRHWDILGLQNSVNSVPPRLLWGTRFSSESTRQQMSDIEKRQQMSPNRLPSSHSTLADPRYRQRQKQWQQWGWSWFYDGHVKGTAQPKTELKICMELYGYVENDKAMYTCFKIHKFCRAIRSNLLGQTPVHQTVRSLLFQRDTNTLGARFLMSSPF